MSFLYRENKIILLLVQYAFILIGANYSFATSVPEYEALMKDESTNRTDWWVREDDPGYEAAMKGDYTTAYDWWWRNQEPDEPRNSHNLGVISVLMGNYKDAVSNFKYSAENMNYAPSQLALYYLYTNRTMGDGQKDTRNHTLAEKWLKRASAQGYHNYNDEARKLYRLDTPLPKAQESAILTPVLNITKLSSSEISKRLKTGIHAYRGDKYKKAIEILEPIALLGNVNAQYYLGLAWFNDGPGVASQYATWFRRAAKQGHPDAQAYYGYCLEHGRGTATNYSLAKSYYKEASKTGNVSAIFRIGQLYDHGKGVPVDEDKAEALYRVAIKLGHKGASDALKYMHNRGKSSIRESDVPALTLLAIGISIYISNLDTTPSAPGNPWDERVKRMKRDFDDSMQQATDSYIIENF